MGDKTIETPRGGVCPWCGEDGLTLSEKLTLGPLVTRKCRRCSRAVRASWPSAATTTALLLVPFIGSLAWGGSLQLQDLRSTLIAAAGLLCGAALSLAWQRQYLRLVRHGGADPAPQP